MEITRVGIVGGGQMGGGIAEVCAKADVDTIVVEVSDELTAKSRTGIEKSLAKAVERGKLEGAARDKALGLLTFDTSRDTLSDWRQW